MAWEWLGDRLAYDFANTRKRHGMRYVDLIDAPEALVTWASLVDLPLSPRQAKARLADVRAFRDEVFALLLACATGQRQPTVVVNRQLCDFPVVDLVTHAPGGTHRRVLRGGAVDTLLSLVAADAVSAVAEPAMLGYCDAPSCGQFFTRPRANQKWCSTACGTRTRVARHGKLLRSASETHAQIAEPKRRLPAPAENPP